LTQNPFQNSNLFLSTAFKIEQLTLFVRAKKQLFARTNMKKFSSAHERLREGKEGPCDDRNYSSTLRLQEYDP
jgi:hypothetical protein